MPAPLVRLTHALCAPVVVLGLSVVPSRTATGTPPVPADPAHALTAHARLVLATDPQGHTLRLQALNQALEQQLLSQAERDIAHTAVAQYYRQYEHHFRQPAAIALWRLLVPTEQQAKELAARVQKSPEPIRAWSNIVREHSLDKATHFRKGSLGYVWPDGNTDVPQVRVSPALFAAATTLADGEFLPTPVKEGPNWALVWRRGSRAARGLSLEQARPQIVQQLAVAAARKQLHDLQQELRQEYLSDYQPEHLDAFFPPAVRLPKGNKRPIVSHPAAGPPLPRPTDLGER